MSTLPISCQCSLSPKPSAIIFSSYSSRSPSIWAEVSCTSYRTAQKLSNGGPHLSHDKIQNLLGTQKQKQIAFIWGKNPFLRSRSDKTMSEPAEQSRTSSGASAVDGSWVPKLDMVFESEEKAYWFYCSYARDIGFVVRKNVVKRTAKNTVYARGFCCYKEGFRRITKEGKRPRPDARTGCGARIIVRLMMENFMLLRL